MAAYEWKRPVETWVQWLSGELSRDEANAVRADIARPDSRIFKALEELDRAIAPLYPRHESGPADRESRARRLKTPEPRRHRDKGGDETPGRA